MNNQAPKLPLLEIVAQTGAVEDQRDAIAVILACATWLESQNVGAGVVSARWLREEVQGDR
jgi:hypothetical protein